MSLFNNYVPFKETLKKHVSQCERVFKEIGDSRSAALVAGLVKDLDEQRYNITIMGSMKRGKSTLLNTLMERSNDDISPISVNVCTSAIIKYIDKELSKSTKGESAKIYFNDVDKAPETVSLRQLRDYVMEERNPQNRKAVRSVEVFGDFPQWSKAVTIIDSPGQNSVFNHHDVLLTDFLPNTDAIIFLVSADIPLDSGEIKLLKELSAAQKRKIFFVLTKIDNLDNPEDLEMVREYVSNTIHGYGLPCDKLYAVSAKPVFQALQRGVSGSELESLKIANGIRELEEDLEKFIVAESDQTRVLRNRIDAIFKQTGQVCEEYLRKTQTLLSQKNYDRATLEAEITELQEKSQELRENTKKSLKKFERNWERVQNRFKAKFSAKSAEVADRVMESLKSGGLITAAFRSFKLKEQVEKALRVEVQPVALDMEEELAKVAQDLNHDLDNDLNLYIKSRRGTDAVSVTGSLVAISAVGATAAWGTSASAAAASTALTAFNSWQAAAATANATGVAAKAWSFFVGGSTAAAAGNAGTAAVTAAVGGIATCAGVAVGLYIASKVSHLLLVKTQETRVERIVEKGLQEMEETLHGSLTQYKENLVKEYQQGIDDMLDDHRERLTEVRRLLEDDDPEERQRISARMENVKALQAQSGKIQQEIIMVVE